MLSAMNVNNRKLNSTRLAAAVAPVLEIMEARQLMSTTIAAWAFDTLPANTSVTAIQSTIPATTGSGTAYTVGMQSGTANGYLYPATGAASTADASTFLAATGNSDSGGAGGSEGGTNGFIWRVESGQDNNAAIGTQGAQFSAATTGDSNIEVQFDLAPSSTGAEAQFMVEYTTDINDGSPVWTDVTSSLAFGSGDTANTQGHVATIGTSSTNDVYIQTNTSNPNLVSGAYATINGPIPSGTNTSWLNDLYVNLPAGANNSPNFAFRVVNAGTSTGETAISGATGPTFKNWRFNDISINSVSASPTAPTVTTYPTNQSVPAGQSVTFTAAASGYPTPTVQWFTGGTPGVGGAAGTGTAISGATSTSYTFTTSSTAADNGTTYYAEFTNASGLIDTTAATLTDTLAAPVVTTQPTNVSSRAGSTVTFTSAATGSPVPTVQWQISTNGGSTWSSDTTDSGNTTGTLSFTAASAENGYEYRAAFNNSQGTVYSNPATLSLGGSVLASWNFGQGSLVAGLTTLSPAPSTGTGTASSLGMGAAGTYSLYPGDPAAAYTLTVKDSSGTYTTSSLAATSTAVTIQTALRALNPATTGSITVTVNPTAALASAVTLTGDTAATLTGSGSSTFFVTLDNSTLTTSQVINNPDNSNLILGADTGSPNADAANINAWRIVGENGWNSAAPIGTQGAQFLTSTLGYSSIEASFDLYASTQGEGKLQAEFTTDGSTWTNVPAADLSIGTGDVGISIANNTTSPNTVQGGYFLLSGTAPGNSWYNGLGINLTGIAGVNNDANFGIRIVNAATGTDCVNISGAALNNTSGNDRLGDVQITGNNPVSPIITLNPTNQSAAAGTTATFTAAAVAYPAATVQWYVSTNGGTTFTADTTDSGNTTNSLKVVASNAKSGYEYEATYTNSVGSATTTAATLGVGPLISTSPVSQTVAAASTVTFTAAATGTPTPTVQWFSEAPGATSFTAITGATSATYAFTALESQTGTEYEAVFTNTAGSATTGIATLTVIGEPIVQWEFSQGEAPTPQSQEFAGDGNSPLPTLGSATANTSAVIGLGTPGNPLYYTGVPQYAESDIVPSRSSVNANFTQDQWRVRAGSGLGPTGSPGSPEGWSQLAPEYSQGVQFNIDTVGYNNLTLHFDWNGGGIADMQAQYYNGSNWVNTGSVIQNFTSDYLGITSTTTPTGVLVNLQGVSAANNNPNFQFRLVAAYDPALPSIVDGDTFGGIPAGASLGQYATNKLGATDAEQILDLGGQPGDGAGGVYNNVSGGTFTLGFGGQTTVAIPYNATPAQVQSALTALSSIGADNVSVTNTMITPYTEYNAASYTIKFQGSLANKPEALITANGSALTGAAPSAYTQNYVYGATTNGVTPYQDGSGAWSLGNFSFNGDVYNASSNTSVPNTAPGIVSSPSSESVVATLPTTVSFTASDYSETTPASVQWQISTNGGSSWSNLSSGSAITGTGPIYSSTYTNSTTYPASAEGTTALYQAVFANPNGSTATFPATLSIVAPVAPVVTTQPKNVSVQQGNVAVFTAAAAGSPTPTIQWQDSSNGGATWTNLTNSATVTGATSNSLYFTTTNDTTENGYEFRAVFTNAVQATNSNTVTLTVLANYSVIADWNFDKDTRYTSGTFTNSPLPYIGTGTAEPVGMTLAYNPNDPATGTNGTGAVPAGDITATQGVLNLNFTENTWRIRSGPTATTGGTPANGWSNFVSEYTQGVEFDTSTTGYGHVYDTMDWNSTTSGELDAREQYTTDGGTTWYNLDDHLPDTTYDPNPTIQAVSGDYYGATATGGPIPLVFDLTGIAGANNNTGFGIRLVNAYDAYLSNTQTVSLGYNDTSNFTLTYNGQTTGTITFSPTYSVLAANIQSALGALSQIGAANVSVAPSSAGFTVTFGGAFANVTAAPLGITDPTGGDSVTQNDQYANAALVGTPPVPAAYNGSKGNWRFDNIVVHAVPVWLDPASVATFTPNFTPTYNNLPAGSLIVAGASKIIGDPGTDEPQITFNSSGAVLTIDTGTVRSVNIGSLTVSGGNTVVMASDPTTHVLIDQGALVTSAGNTVNIGNNFLDLQTATLAGVVSQITSGTLFTTNTSAGGLGAIGAITNGTNYGSSTTLGLFDGANPGTGDVLVRYTYIGDANLDGRVDGSDYTEIDNGFNGKLAGWANGDFNYDGKVDGSDYTLIDNAFNTQGSKLVPQAQVAAQVAGGAIPSSNVFSSSLPTSLITDLLKKDQADTLVSVVDAA